MKYFNSYKLFHGKNQFEGCLILTVIMAVVMILTGVIIRISNNDYFNGFVSGLVPFICSVLAMTVGYAMINNVFNGNMRMDPGYRFFHSLPDGTEHFRRALIASNVLAIISMAVYAVLGVILFEGFFTIMLVAAGFMTLGLTNLTGHMKNPWIRLVTFCVIGFGYGFYAGFTGDEEEGIAELPPNVTAIICAAVLAFYLISAVVVAMRAEKLWNKEG